VQKMAERWQYLGDLYPQFDAPTTSCVSIHPRASKRSHRPRSTENWDVTISRLVVVLTAPTAADSWPRLQRECLLLLDGEEAGDGGDGESLRAVIAVERRR